MSRKEKTGKVVSDKMDKTCVVAIVERQSHPRYKKIHIQTKRFKAHDPENKARIGDIVRIVESRKYSKDKCWALAEVVQHIEEV